MPRFLDFVAQNGAPVSLIPEDVQHLRGYERTDRETGEVSQFTTVVFKNRDAVFVRGTVEAVKAGIEAAVKENAPKLNLWPTGPAISPLLCGDVDGGAANG